jgi:hypothetical protein
LAKDGGVITTAVFGLAQGRHRPFTGIVALCQKLPTEQNGVVPAQKNVARAERTIHKVAKEAFTQAANERGSLAIEIAKIEGMRKFTETAERAARKVHAD